jgi:uncharacterized protein YodC (DUF2158 family)
MINVGDFVVMKGTTRYLLVTYMRGVFPEYRYGIEWLDRSAVKQCAFLPGTCLDLVEDIGSLDPSLVTLPTVGERVRMRGHGTPMVVTEQNGEHGTVTCAWLSDNFEFRTDLFHPRELCGAFSP